MQDDLYCKVYITGAPDIASLKATIASVAGARLERRTIRTSSLEIDIFDQFRHESDDPGADFVRWPAYLEVFAADGVDFEAFLTELAKMLNGLLGRRLRVVPSCDFESLLATAMSKPQN